jgi:MarR family transcriptional regulator, negative regulator of the multidrug operon emrRAB
MLSRDTRTANLLGALALEAATAVQAAGAVVGQGAGAGALVTIAAHPGRTVEELREPLGLSQPGAARLVQRLVDAGWVERSGPGGRGGLRLRPTAAGLALLDELFAARRAALLELLEPLSGPEREALASMLERMLAARTAGTVGAKRLCRLCERHTCERCPVARAA